MQQKDFRKIEKKNNNVFCYESKLAFPIYVSESKFKKLDGFITRNYGNKSRYAYIKDFDRFTFHKTKNKNKIYVCKSCLQCFSSKNVLKEYKKFV